MEIALKIAEKIRAGERFAAYIIVPMWPEGVPTGPATQRILYWQVGFISFTNISVLHSAPMINSN